MKPGDDFWSYVNGSWDKRRRSLPDRASAGPFVTLSDAPRRTSAQIVEVRPTRRKRDHLGQQIGDFYASFMDTARSMRQGQPR